MHNSAYRAGAIRLLARLTFAPVDLETMLKIAKRAIGLAVVAQGRSARCNRLCQGGANFMNQPFHPRCAYSMGGACRMNARAVKRLADIYIAQARNDSLISQKAV